MARTNYCYLSLLFSLLNASCASFAFLNGRVFSVLGQSVERHKWSFVLYIVSFSAKLSLAKYRCLHKKHTYFMSSVTTERLYRYLFYKFFCTNLSRVVLMRFYTERFLCNWFVWLLFVWSLHFIELIWSFNNRIIHISMQKVATIFQFTRSD